ncbi:hypothetical protein MHYP_G00172960 [Metynnis hypsauchen]
MAEYDKKDLEKELDNKFGVGNWQWKTLEEQIMILAKAVYDLDTELKKCKKLKQDTEEQLRKWMQVKGRSPQDQTSLGQALNDFTASAMKELGEAKAEHEKAGTFKKGKVRKRLSEAEQNIAKIRRLKCTYNGNLDRMVQSGGQAPPPPYVKPTPGIYPVIDVQSGTIDIKPQQPALTTQCTERIREWMCQTQNQPRAAESTPLEYNFNPNNPFGNRVAHEQPNAPPIDPQSGGGPTLLRRPTQDGSPFSPPVVSGAHGFGKGCPSVHWSQGEDMVMTETGEPPQTHQWCGGHTCRLPAPNPQCQPEQVLVAVKCVFKGMYYKDQDDGSSSSSSVSQGSVRAGLDIDERLKTLEVTLEQQLAKLERESRAEAAQSNQIEGGVHTRTRSHTRRHSDGDPSLMAPLLANSQGDMKYVPFNLSDAAGLAEQLPPLTAGGGPWLKQLAKLTGGVCLAIGDFRNLLNRATTALDAADVERQADIEHLHNSEPFTPHSAAISAVMRKKWPVQASSTVPSYPWDGKTNPAEYMGLAAEDWINRTSTHPGHEGVQQMWFRTAVLKGIPEYVRSKMEEDPNMGPDATHDAWLKTILFHMNKHKEKVDARTGEVDKLQFELVKAQLAEARKTLNEDKKKSKPAAASPDPAVAISTTANCGSISAHTIWGSVQGTW